MRLLVHFFAILLLLFAPFPIVAAQTALDPSGHWEGAVAAGDQSVPVVFDVTKHKEGLGGTFSGGPENVKDLPLTSVTLKGRQLRIVVPGGDAGEAVFEGVVADDGVVLKGQVLFAGQSYPFSVTRTASKRP
jgi:hypothetical protein